jgi:hypothetical protein
LDRFAILTSPVASSESFAKALAAINIPEPQVRFGRLQPATGISSRKQRARVVFNVIQIADPFEGMSYRASIHLADLTTLVPKIL